MKGELIDGTSWSIGDWGYIKIFHMNEQHPLSLDKDDLVSLTEALAQWQQEMINKEAKELAEKEKKEKKEYEDYLRLKDKFEK